MGDQRTLMDSLHLHLTPKDAVSDYDILTDNVDRVVSQQQARSELFAQLRVVERRLALTRIEA